MSATGSFQPTAGRLLNVKSTPTPVLALRDAVSRVVSRPLAGRWSDGLSPLVERYDTAIVGAGSAGAILAARLTEDGARTVCLIEAGPDHADLAAMPDELRTASMIDERHAPYLWHHTARATPLRPALAVPSGRVVGGSSAINTTVFLWALRPDLDAWAEVAGSSWSYEACVPYFQRIESDLDFPDGTHGTTGPVPVERPARSTWSKAAAAYHELCVSLGHPECPDLNAPDAVGVGPVPFNKRDGVRMSTAVAYLAPARTRPNLTILARSCARRVVCDGTRAVAVEVATEAGPLVVEAGEIVLSAGAIASPQLLMLSGIGPAEDVARAGITPIADLRCVGGNLRNHPLCATAWSIAPTYGEPELLGIPWQTQLRTTAPGSTDREDACLGMAVLGARPVATAAPVTATSEPKLGISALLMHAASSGTVRLASADPDIQPEIDLNYLAEPSDLERMRAMVRLAVELGRHSRLDGLRGELLAPTPADLATDAALDEWMLRNVLTSHHPAGTCRMGSDDGSVVDDQGRVHGFEGLRVVDASIMPDCPRVNVNATTMMVAEKIADAMRGIAPATTDARAPA
jgi:choline dehydrogenase